MKELNIEIIIKVFEEDIKNYQEIAKECKYKEIEYLYKGKAEGVQYVINVLKKLKEN